MAPEQFISDQVHKDLIDSETKTEKAKLFRGRFFTVLGTLMMIGGITGLIINIGGTQGGMTSLMIAGLCCIIFNRSMDKKHRKSNQAIHARAKRPA